jgi:hypothetical protein
VPLLHVPIDRLAGELRCGHGHEAPQLRAVGTDDEGSGSGAVMEVPTIRFDATLYTIDKWTCGMHRPGPVKKRQA